MELRRFNDPAQFSAHTRAFLLAHEAHHSLILGVTARVVAHPEQYRAPSYLATVERDHHVVAVAVMTAPQYLILSLAAPEALPMIVTDLSTRYGALAGIHGPSEVSRAFADEWRAASGCSYRRAIAMRLYQLTAVVPVIGVPGTLRRATAAERDLLVTWIWGTDAETYPPQGVISRDVDDRLHDADRGVFIWEVDGQPVSMAGQEGPTPHGIHINSVCTPPEYRRRGYASACVAALSQHLLDRGYRFCALFTDLSNPTANHIYQTIGYTPVCDVDRYLFRPA